MANDGLWIFRRCARLRRNHSDGWLLGVTKEDAGWCSMWLVAVVRCACEHRNACKEACAMQHALDSSKEVVTGGCNSLDMCMAASK